jgi:hypothetical protein
MGSRSFRTENTDKNVEGATAQSLPLKRQDSDEYFRGTKQSKSKGRRRNKYEAVISMEDLERPPLEAVIQHKNMQSHQKPSHAPSRREQGEYSYSNNER